MQEAGGRRKREQDEALRALFERGEVPEGDRKAEVVVIEE